jgi:hypothetical protein
MLNARVALADVQALVAVKGVSDAGFASISANFSSYEAKLASWVSSGLGSVHELLVSSELVGHIHAKF